MAEARISGPKGSVASLATDLTLHRCVFHNEITGAGKLIQIKQKKKRRKEHKRFVRRENKTNTEREGEDKTKQKKKRTQIVYNYNDTEWWVVGE